MIVRDRSTPNPKAKPVAWDQFEKELIGLYAPGLRSRGTKLKMRQALSLVKHLETTDGLNTDTLAEIITSHPHWSPRTTWGLLGCLRTAANYAYDKGYLEQSPFTLRPIHTLVHRGRPRSKKHLTREETRNILATMASDVAELQGWQQWFARRLQALTAVVAYCGLRASEAQLLHASDIDIKESMINVTERAAHRLKTDAAAAPVPMPRALRPIVESWTARRLDAPPDFPINQDCPWLFPTASRERPWVSGRDGCKPLDRLKTVAKRAGVEHATFQMLRHGWATHSSYWGVSRGMSQRVLRHTSDRMIESWYTHDDLENLRSSVADIDF